jgi:hypothetical protein
VYIEIGLVRGENMNGQLPSSSWRFGLRLLALFALLTIEVLAVVWAAQMLWNSFASIWQRNAIDITKLPQALGALLHFITVYWVTIPCVGILVLTYYFLYKKAKVVVYGRHAFLYFILSTVSIATIEAIFLSILSHNIFPVLRSTSWPGVEGGNIIIVSITCVYILAMIQAAFLNLAVILGWQNLKRRYWKSTSKDKS